jgi:hypothetical protein
MSDIVLGVETYGAYEQRILLPYQALFPCFGESHGVCMEPGRSNQQPEKRLELPRTGMEYFDSREYLAFISFIFFR